MCVVLLQVNGQTYGPELWQKGQVEGYIGQICRSKVRVTGSKHLLCISMASEMHIMSPAKEMTLEDTSTSEHVMMMHGVLTVLNKGW